MSTTRRPEEPTGRAERTRGSRRRLERSTGACSRGRLSRDTTRCPTFPAHARPRRSQAVVVATGPRPDRAARMPRKPPLRLRGGGTQHTCAGCRRRVLASAADDFGPPRLPAGARASSFEARWQAPIGGPEGCNRRDRWQDRGLGQGVRPLPAHARRARLGRRPGGQGHVGGVMATGRVDPVDVHLVMRVVRDERLRTEPGGGGAKQNPS
jgi:hypothetical protein